MKYYIVKKKNKDNSLEFKAYTNLREAKRFVRIHTNGWCIGCDNVIRFCGCKPKRISIHEVNEKLLMKKGM